jgi:hypothetical protein
MHFPSTVLTIDSVIRYNTFFRPFPGLNKVYDRAIIVYGNYDLSVLPRLLTCGTILHGADRDNLIILFNISCHRLPARFAFAWSSQPIADTRDRVAAENEKL